MAGHFLGAKLVFPEPPPEPPPEPLPEPQPGINEKSNIVVTEKCDFYEV